MLADSAATVMHKPMSRAAVIKALSTLGFYEQQDHTLSRTVVYDDPK